VVSRNAAILAVCSTGILHVATVSAGGMRVRNTGWEARIPTFGDFFGALLQIWRQRAGRMTAFLLWLGLRAVFMLVPLAVAALHCGWVRIHRKSCVLRIRRTVEALLRLRALRARKSGAGLRSRTLRPFHRPERASHFPKLRSHAKRTRAIEIADLRSARERRAWARLFRTGTTIIFLSLRRRRKAARLTRPAARWERRQAAPKILRESRVGVASPLTRPLVMVRTALPAVWVKTKLRMTGCDWPASLSRTVSELRIRWMSRVARITHRRRLRSRPALRKIRRSESFPRHKRWLPRCAGSGLGGPPMLGMMSELRIRLVPVAVKSGALVRNTRLALGRISPLALPRCE
jgi:hypothetical protein